jgi:hypothetical protein
LCEDIRTEGNQTKIRRASELDGTFCRLRFRGKFIWV